ncbi:MAG: sensor histidine kinase [Bradymonadia bacterium]
MTLRIRLLLIGLVILITGGALIATSYYHIAKLHRGAQALVATEFDSVRQQSAIRTTMHRLRIAQERFNSGAGEAFEAESQRLRDQLRGLIEQASEHWEKSEIKKVVVSEELSHLDDLSKKLSENRSAHRVQIEKLSTTLASQVQLIAGRSNGLVSQQGESALPQEIADRVERFSIDLLQTFELLRYASAEALTPWKEALDTHLAHLKSLRRRVIREMAGSAQRRPTLGLIDSIGKVLLEMQVNVVKRESVERRFIALEYAWLEHFETLWEYTAALTADERQRVETRMTEIQNRRYNSLIWLIGMTVVGFGLAALLMGAFIGSMERDLWALKDLARRLERGESPRDEVKLPGGVSELGELGGAFNHLARSLISVKEQQHHRDQLVTGLNRSVHVSDILRLSLKSLSQATGAKAGCMYLKMAGREELLLAESFAVLRGAMLLERVRFGEGLVGQAARDRESLHFADVPLADLKIITGVIEAHTGSILVVPMIFQDELMGVVELAGMTPFDEEVRHFVEDSIFQIAVALNNARSVETIRTSAVALEQKTRELEEVNTELEQANQLKSEFLATVSHELRTPLNAIIGFTELVMLRDGQMKDTSRENLGKVMRNAEQLLALITDILDLSRIEAGKITIDVRPVDVGELLSECTGHLKPMADSKGIALAHEVDEAVGVVLIDQDKFTRIVQNLVSNAIKFTEEGEVRVKLWPHQDRLFLEVRDTGIGIDTELLPAIFEKFRQADGSRTRRYSGSGLGLAITKELCHSMGGSVKVSSQKGEGSVFRVSLPLERSGEIAEG